MAFANPQKLRLFATCQNTLTTGRRLTIAPDLWPGSQGAVTDAAAWVGRKSEKAAHQFTALLVVGIGMASTEGLRTPKII